MVLFRGCAWIPHHSCWWTLSLFPASHCSVSADGTVASLRELSVETGVWKRAQPSVFACCVFKERVPNSVQAHGSVRPPRNPMRPARSPHHLPWPGSHRPASNKWVGVSCVHSVWCSWKAWPFCLAPSLNRVPVRVSGGVTSSRGSFPWVYGVHHVDMSVCLFSC